MPTLNQLIRDIRHKRYGKKTKNQKHLLCKCPQKLAICNKIRIMKPKKPNSAQRQVARVKITSTNRWVTVSIPGKGHTLQQFSNVLIRGGRVRDLPGIHYRVVRGTKDAKAVPDTTRKQRRSKFGVPRPAHVAIEKDFMKNQKKSP